MKRTTALVFAGAAALAIALSAPTTAFAHVTVSPNSASAGTYALVNVKVPNESATAVTNRVEIALPTDTPFTSVSYVPVAGWTAKLVRTTLPTPVKIGDNTITEAVTSVEWQAQAGHEISAGQLQVFPLSLGPVPDTGKIVMPAEQTYSDGTVVSWTQTTEGAEHPAPVLYVNDSPSTGHHGDDSSSSGDDHDQSVHGSADPDSDAHGPSEVHDAGASSDTLARALGVGGLVVGAIGIVLATTARRGARR